MWWFIHGAIPPGQRSLIIDSLFIGLLILCLLSLYSLFISFLVKATIWIYFECYGLLTISLVLLYPSDQNNLMLEFWVLFGLFPCLAKLIGFFLYHGICKQNFHVVPLQIFNGFNDERYWRIGPDKSSWWLNINKPDDIHFYL